MHLRSARAIYEWLPQNLRELLRKLSAFTYDERTMEEGLIWLLGPPTHSRGVCFTHAGRSERGNAKGGFGFV